jgi:acetylornithine/succinyldiaminopimelate/putrescine aminotransferase
MARSRRVRFRPVRLSLADLGGRGYAESVCQARAFLTRERPAAVRRLLREKVDFYPAAFQRRVQELLPLVGTAVVPALKGASGGASTDVFNAATCVARAPRSCLGPFRIGEDGRLYLTTKSEHYHASLGHGFPGYRLIEMARSVGIPNPTHNNTRGHLTRVLERELIRVANGIAQGDERAVSRVVASKGKTAINRVLNLETGSLAMEAAIKMMLSRFYRARADSPPPAFRRRVPVMVVLGDHDGGLSANYHGTTLFAQALRGMWPTVLEKFEKQGLMAVRAVPPNDLAALEAAFEKYNRGKHRVAGFFHELVLMNYGGLTLSRTFIRRAYALCRVHDVPTVVDEIQTGLWHPDLLMYREFGLRPTFVALGKGFPGGEFPASRILFNGQMDRLPQFGALVTNGQEELASLAYLISMRWAEANSDITRGVGDYFETRMRELADAHRDRIVAVHGSRHCLGLHFDAVEGAKRFAQALNEQGLDISTQVYKTSCPPAALMKPPLTAGYELVDLVVEKMVAVLRASS